MKAKLFDSALRRLLALAISLLLQLFFIRLIPLTPLSNSLVLSLVLFFSLSFNLSRTLPLRSSALFPSLAYTLAPLLFPTAAPLPSSFHPSNFSTPFTKIKINSGTTCPGTMPETPLPSSAAAYRRLQKAYTMLASLY